MFVRSNQGIDLVILTWNQRNNLYHNENGKEEADGDDELRGWTGKMFWDMKIYLGRCQEGRDLPRHEWKIRE